MISSKRMKVEVEIPRLPEEILEEIFLRLPIKSLLKQTSVCKLWNSLIKTSSFIQAYQHRNQNRHHLLTEARVATIRAGGKEGTRHSFYVHCDEPPFALFKSYFQHITHPLEAYNRLHAKDKLKMETIVMETCNGLVCLVAAHESSCTALIWNPCIRKFVMLPQLTLSTKASRLEVDAISHGFGYDSRNNDYKVVRIVRYKAQTKRETSYEIWSLAQPSCWKALSVSPPVDNFGPYMGSRTIFVRGAVHWVHANWKNKPMPYHTIVFFDMPDQVFGEITMPEAMMIKREHSISRYKNSLAMLQWDWDNSPYGRKQIDLWVMKEYGVVESWTKSVTVEVPGYVTSIRPVGFRNSGEALNRYDNGREPTPLVHILLNPDSGGNAKFQARGAKFVDYIFVEPFVQSLVLLNNLVHCRLT